MDFRLGKYFLAADPAVITFDTFKSVRKSIVFYQPSGRRHEDTALSVFTQIENPAKFLPDAVFAVIFVLGIACFMEPNSSVAKAADGSGKNVSGCHYISYTKENAIASFGQQDEIPVATPQTLLWIHHGLYIPDIRYTEAYGPRWGRAYCKGIF